MGLTASGPVLRSLQMSSTCSRGTGPGSPTYKDEKLIYPAATRNKEPILQTLRKVLPSYFTSFKNVNFLEISSGSGQHIAHIAPHFPDMTFQPSEYAEDTLGSISIYANECPTKNIKKPILINIVDDLSTYGFQPEHVDIMFCSNMIHVTPIICTSRLLENAGRYLKSNGLLITYGPYAVDGVITPESNVNFNNSLKAQNPLWGIRCINEMKDIAGLNGLVLQQIHDMPSNNKCLVWQKSA
ncbi:methyltransferase-like 26 isoform X2 [Arctopsyche grandis]|uniref:methyltransferase-like 26 isoform X2 n=1 Tax=Arctopsyche grandis TaxID=121162 RepID=UPI00406D815F